MPIFTNGLRHVVPGALLWLLLSCSPAHSVAQDPVFSQFFNNPTYFNPAYVGMDGGVTVTTAYRRQWNEIPGGFNTYYAGVESLESCTPLALGMQFWQDVEGEGALQTTAASLPVAGVLPFGSVRRPVNLRLAFAPYFMQKTIDWEQLVFSDQLDPKEGAILASQFQGSDQIPVRFGGVDLGLLLRWDKPTKWKENMEFEIGFAVKNALNFRLDTGPVESLQGLTTGLPIRYVAHAGLYAPFFKIGSRMNIFRFVPQVRYEHQGGLSVTSLGFLGYYQGASLGLFYQNTHPAAGFENTDALTCYLGLGWNLDRTQAIDIGLSYDINVGGLRSMSGGVFEVSLRYFIESSGPLCGLLNSGARGGGGRGPNSSIRCPRIGRKHRKRWEGIWYRKGQ